MPDSLRGVRPVSLQKARSGELLGGVLNGLIDVLRAHIELFGDVLLGLEVRLVDGICEGALANDDKSGLPSVEMSPNSLTSDATCPPQVTAHAADRRSNGGADDDGGWEDDPHKGSDRCSARLRDGSRSSPY